MMLNYNTFHTLNIKIPNLKINELLEDQINKPNIKDLFYKLIMQYESCSNLELKIIFLYWLKK
jgi:hypothetical protein